MDPEANQQQTEQPPKQEAIESTVSRRQSDAKASQTDNKASFWAADASPFDPWPPVITTEDDSMQVYPNTPSPIAGCTE